MRLTGNKKPLIIAVWGFRVPRVIAWLGNGIVTEQSSEIDKLVGMIDDDRQSTLFRSPDRPSTRFVPRPRQKQDPSVRRAKGRARTAAWRNELDRNRRPEASDIGMALVTALVTSNDLRNATGPELRFVTAALADLESRGFDRAQVLHVLRRLRKRLVNPVDRKADESENRELSSSSLF
jgi:hypothetical protein